MANHNKIIKYTIIGLTFLIISIFYTFLFAPHGSIHLLDSYDLLFHWNRIDSLGNILKSPTNFDYWNHVGNFTNMFYPWLTILPGYLIYKLVGTPLLGFLIFLTLITFLTMVSAYYFMNKWAHNTLQSLLFAIIYTLSFFRLASVFYRVGVAEYLSYIFMPMVFYAAAKLLAGEFESWPILALGMSLIILTHPLTAVTVIIIMLPLPILILFNKISHHWQYWGELLVNGAKAIVLVIITSVGFFLPMIEQKRALQINRPALLDLAQTAQSPYLLFKNSLHTDIRSYSLGIIAIVALILIVLFVWQDKFSYRIVAIEAIIAVILSTKIFPWSSLQNTPLNYLQFPWRFLNIANFFLAIYLSHILVKIVQKFSAIVKLMTLLMVMTACVLQVYMSAQQLFQQTQPLAIITSKNINRQIHEFNQLDYYPQKSLPYSKQIKHHLFLVDGVKTKLNYQTTPDIYQVKYYNKKSATLDLPILFYKGVHVTINNVTVPAHSSHRDTVQIQTQPGVNNIEISYQYTVLAKVALAISCFSLISLILIVSEHKWQLLKKLRKVY
ncbi:MAG: hypothetical protein J6573_06890 [Lactobacillus sp.]|nr:hypothetical protein [Lactobacillus sp.]